MSDDFCAEPSGPYRITLRGARETVVETRADVFAVLDAMTPDQRCAVAVDVGWRHETGDYVYSALLPQCGPPATPRDAATDGEGEPSCT